MKVIFVDLDVFILMKEKLEVEIEFIEQKILYYCLSIEQWFVSVNEDKNQFEELLVEWENKFFGELNIVQFENVFFGVCIWVLEDVLEDLRILIKKKEEEMVVFQ